MKRTIIIPIVALLLVAVSFLASNVKPATARGNTPQKLALLDTIDDNPYRCTYVDINGDRCGNFTMYSSCWPRCEAHCCWTCR